MRMSLICGHSGSDAIGVEAPLRGWRGSGARTSTRGRDDRCRKITSDTITPEQDGEVQRQQHGGEKGDEQGRGVGAARAEWSLRMRRQSTMPTATRNSTPAMAALGM